MITALGPVARAAPWPRSGLPVRGMRRITGALVEGPGDPELLADVFTPRTSQFDAPERRAQTFSYRIGMGFLLIVAAILLVGSLHAQSGRRALQSLETAHLDDPESLPDVGPETRDDMDRGEEKPG